MLLVPLGAALKAQPKRATISLEGRQLGVRGLSSHWCRRCSLGRLLYRPLRAGWRRRQRQHRPSGRPLRTLRWRPITMVSMGRRHDSRSFLLQHCESASSIQILGSHDKHNRFNVRTEAVDETHGEIRWISCAGIRRKMIDQLSESLDIVGHCRSLVDVVELTNQKFLLVAIKAIVEQTAEFQPGTCFDL